MAGFGDFGLGLAEGYTKGQNLRRQDESDARAAEDRQQAQEDRGINMKRAAEDRQYTLSQRDVLADQQGRQKKAQEFSDAQVEAGRKVAPFVIGKDPLGAVDVIENEFNTTPAFSNGVIHKIARDEAGKPVVDKDGLITLSVIDQKSGKEMKQGQVDPRAYIGWFNHIDNPWEAVKTEQDAAAAEATHQKRRAEKKEDLEFGINAKTDAEIRRDKARAADGVGGGGRAGTAKEIQLYNFWKSIFPKDTPEQTANRVNAGRKKDPQSMMTDLIKAHMSTTGETDMSKSKEVVLKAFPALDPDYVEPNTEAPDGTRRGSGATASYGQDVDDVATELGF